MIEKQAARIEAELNEARQEEREKMMDQLNWLRETADQQLSDQREQYELQLKDLFQKNENYIQVDNYYTLWEHAMFQFNAHTLSLVCTPVELILIRSIIILSSICVYIYR